MAGLDAAGPDAGSDGAVSSPDSGVPDPGIVTPGGATVPTQGRFATAGEPRAAGELVLQDDGFETRETLCAGELCVRGGLEP